MTPAGHTGAQGDDGHEHVAFDRLIPSDVREIEPIVEQVTRECRELSALTSYLLDDGLDLANVAGYEPVEGNVRMRGAKMLSAVAVSSH